MRNTKIISVFNQKGGVGKTSFTLNFATTLTYFSKEVMNKEEVKVLIIDNDSQSNATFILSNGLLDDAISENKNIITIEQILKDRALTIHKSAVTSKFKNIDVICSTVDHASTDLKIMYEPENTDILRKRIDGAIGLYDFILIDNPPQIGLSTLNSLSCSDYCIAPIEGSVFSVKGLNNLVGLIRDINEAKVKKEPLKLITFLNKVDNRKKVNIVRVKKTLERLLDTAFIKNEHISLSTASSDCFEEMETCMTFKKSTTNKKEYIALTKSILTRMEEI